MGKKVRVAINGFGRTPKESIPVVQQKLTTGQEASYGARGEKFIHSYIFFS